MATRTSDLIVQPQPTLSIEKISEASYAWEVLANAAKHQVRLGVPWSSVPGALAREDSTVCPVHDSLFDEELRGRAQFDKLRDGCGTFVFSMPCRADEMRDGFPHSADSIAEHMSAAFTGEVEGKTATSKPDEQANADQLEYSPEVVEAGDCGEPDFIGCPTVSGWTDTIALQNGNMVLTTEQDLTIIFGYGLARVALHSELGFRRREIVSAICKTFQAARFQPDHNFLERITVDDGLITFHLGK
jgi:hypothetical protein